jgi:hypothetical protein
VKPRGRRIPLAREGLVLVVVLVLLLETSK